MTDFNELIDIFKAEMDHAKADAKELAALIDEQFWSGDWSMNWSAGGLARAMKQAAAGEVLGLQRVLSPVTIPGPVERERLVVVASVWVLRNKRKTVQNQRKTVDDRRISDYTTHTN